MATIKQICSDFIVQEVSLKPPDLSMRIKDKANTIVTVEKAGYTTIEASHIIANWFNLSFNEVHFQGLKDEDGITIQSMSIAKIVQQDDLANFNSDNYEVPYKYIKILIVGYSNYQLKERSLHGNLFQTTIRDLSNMDVENIVQKLAINDRFVFLNYYDSQRFGLPGGPYLTHKIGQAIVEDNLEEAYEYFQLSGNFNPDKDNNPFRTKALDIRQVQFFISSYYSYIWNNKLAEQITPNNYIHVFDNYDLPTIKASQSILPQLSIDVKRLNNSWIQENGIKTRSTAITTAIYLTSHGTDKYSRKDNRFFITLNFMLPTGVYATMMLKQLLSKEKINY